MRRVPALTVAASLLVVLTACTGVSTGSGASTGCDTGITDGGASEAVSATGSFGEAPEVTFPTPLITDSVERTTLIAGDSAPLRDGQPVLIEATILNGADAAVIQQTGYVENGGSLFTVGDDGLPALGAALECASLGSRIAVAASAAENVGGGESATDDSVIYVVDLLRAFKSRADGANQLPESGMPAVVISPDGTPGITVPNEPAPTDYRRNVLKRGDGDEVADDSIAVVKYTAVGWSSETVTESTWATGSAAPLDLAGESVSEGLRQAVVGQTVGSQILAVIPPGLAGTAEAPAGGDTLVYVVDILGIIQ